MTNYIHIKGIALILYDKDTKFLGASADILSALGYEDINAFRAYNDDVADLFINKQGYVHKFDNFSWISYVLNGSLPNKKVVMKTRSNNEIEASISIIELFLNDKDDKCYIISLDNIRQISDDTEKKDELYSKQPIFKIDDISAKQPTFTEQQPNITNNAASNESTDDKISFTFNEEDLNPVVSKTDKTAPTDTQNLKDKINTERYQSQTTGQNNKNTVEIKIDVQEISDILGIEKTDIIEYLKEYVSYLDANLGQLQELYKNGNVAQARHIVINLIGIGSNLRSKELVQTLQKLLSIGNNINNTLILQDLEAVVFAFRQSVSKL
ncbi:MAG: hypothetical protein LBS39_01105 [Campylobacteraceae bacterium]|jgi:hypothetical protein|nr:hypothetical protein [Campylobacteraceae bacterium]